MVNKMPADFSINTICRVCLQNSDDFKPIFEKLEGETTAADILKECTKYPVSSDKLLQLPQNICKKCIVDALSAFKFKRKCEESYRKLLKLARLSNVVKVETIEKGIDPLKIEENERIIKQFVCNICGREFKLRQHLRRHLFLIHKIIVNPSDQDYTAEDGFDGDSESPFDCDEDDDKPLVTLQGSKKPSNLFERSEEAAEKSFGQSTNGDNLSNKINDALFSCTECAKVFKREYLLHKHITARHGSLEKNQSQRHQDKHNEKSHKCTICEKSFTTKIYLQRHIEIHKRKRFVCRECSQSFSNKDELSAHVKAEGHDKPLLCPECGLRSKTKNILMVHMRRHRGEKPYKCKFCSKGFPRMDDLRVHEKYHTGEKSHFCETCGKGFQRKYNLTIHLRVHTREKPYKCQHCPQAFAQGNDLKSHIRRHTGERFRCEICDAAFLQGYQIRQHKLCEHGIREDPPTQRVAKFISTEAQEMQIRQNLQNELKQSIDAKTLEKDVINVELDSLPIDINKVGSSASEVFHSLETSDFTNIQF